jgi:hypothetical protein
LENRSKDFLTEVKKHDLAKATNLKAIMPRATERMLATPKK